MKRIGIWTLTLVTSVIAPIVLIPCTYVLLVEKWWNWVMPEINRFNKELMEN